MDIRKTVFTKEIITADEMGQASDPITRVVAMAVVRNPYAGVHHEDLSPLFDVGRTTWRVADKGVCGHVGSTRCLLWQSRSCRIFGRNGARSCLVAPRTWQTGAGSHRRRQIPDAVQPQGLGVGRID